MSGIRYITRPVAAALACRRELGWAWLVPWLALLWMAGGPGYAFGADTMWRRYTSPESGISIEYPASWQLAESPPQGLLVEAPDGDAGRGECRVSVGQTRTENGLDAAALLDHVTGSMVLGSFRKVLRHPLLVGSGVVQMGGQPAFMAEIETPEGDHNSATPYRLFSVFTYYGDRQYTLLCGAADPRYSEMRPMFERIRESLQIGVRPLPPAGSDLATYVSGVGRRLASAQGMPELGFSVVDSEAPRLMVLNGPRIGISRGMLSRLDNEAELAAVLAHQIAHLAAGHGYGPYTEEQDREADRIAVRCLTENDYDPSAVVAVLERPISHVNPSDPDRDRDLSATFHPSATRMADLHSLAGQFAGHGGFGAERYRRAMTQADLSGSR